MSLFDALLLDPVRINLWFAVRSDRNKGCGSQADPYNSLKFDEIMNDLPSSPPVRVHLGPGEFLTNGYADGVSGGWQPRPGMKIAGSGIDVTRIKVTGAQNPPSGTRHYWAVGHLLGVGGSLMNDFEISDLTIDCALGDQSGTTFAIGAVRIMGHHAKVRRIKVVNWGTKSSGPPCYVISMISADAAFTNPDGTWTQILDTGIDECIAIDPDVNTGTPVTVLHVGPKAGGAGAKEGVCLSSFIRNCYVDCSKFANPLSIDVRALSMGWCQNGVVEGNEIHRVRVGGPYLEAASVRHLTVRNNTFNTVRHGPYFNLGTFGSTFGSGSTLTRAAGITSGSVNGHGLLAGDRVEVAANDTSFNGVFMVSNVPGVDSFQYANPGTDGSTTATSIKKVHGVGSLILEGNTFELPRNTEGDRAVWLYDGGQSVRLPDYIHGDIFVRNNKIGYVDGEFGANWTGTGIEIDGAKHGSIRDNILAVAPINPIASLHTGSVVCFNNRSPDGELIQGFNDDTDRRFDELETEVEDALLLALFNRR